MTEILHAMHITAVTEMPMRRQWHYISKSEKKIIIRNGYHVYMTFSTEEFSIHMLLSDFLLEEIIKYKLYIVSYSQKATRHLIH